MTQFSDFSVKTAQGDMLALSQFANRTVLVVNTASACGFTPQFAGLQQLHQRYEAQGLTILGFPCNQFGQQDPGTQTQILSFCQLNYGVSFPMLSKVDVNGAHAEPLFQWLGHQAPGLLGSRSIKWNFTKFLVHRDAQTVQRFAPWTKPLSLACAIERAL